MDKKTIRVTAVFIQEFYELTRKFNIELNVPEGVTVKDLIETIDRNYVPGFKEKILDENGKLRWPVEIAVNGRRIDFLKGLDTPLKDGDRVLFSPRALFVV